VPVKGSEPFLADDAGRAAVADAGATVDPGLLEDGEDGLVVLSGLVVRSPSTACCGDPVPGRCWLDGGVLVDVDVVGVDVVVPQPPGVVQSLPPPWLPSHPPGVVQSLPPPLFSQLFGFVQVGGGGVTVGCTQPVCAGFVRPMPWLRSHS
jgi:hypothetical protein